MEQNLSDQNPSWILLRPSDIAERLKISRSMAYKLICTGELPCVRIGRSVRIRLEDLEKFILENISH